MTDYRCDTGSCVRVASHGGTTYIWESTRPVVQVETSTESWEAFLQTVRDTERARIVAALRNYPWTAYWSVAERLEQGDLATGPTPPPENRPAEFAAAIRTAVWLAGMRSHHDDPAATP
jgi:hypothetical protein